MSWALGFMIVLAASMILPTLALIVALGYGMMKHPTKARKRGAKYGKDVLTHMMKGKIH